MLLSDLRPFFKSTSKLEVMRTELKYFENIFIKYNRQHGDRRGWINWWRRNRKCWGRWRWRSRITVSNRSTYENWTNRKSFDSETQTRSMSTEKHTSTSMSKCSMGHGTTTIWWTYCTRINTQFVFCWCSASKFHWWFAIMFTPKRRLLILSQNLLHLRKADKQCSDGIQVLNDVGDLV